MKAKKSLIAFLLIISFYAIGYFRNYVFITLNEQASALYYHTDIPQVNGVMSFIAGKSYQWLYNFKWVLTFISTFAYAICCSLSIFLLYKDRKNTVIGLVFYSLIFLVAFVFIALGFIFHNISASTFGVARSIMHLGQSPIPTLLCILGIYFYGKQGFISK